jgi:hypothetical protein
MGDGDDAPAAPDYSWVQDTIKDMVSYATKTSGEQMEWAKKAYSENKKVSDMVIDKALGWMDRQEDWAIKDRAMYETVFQPLERALAKEAEEYATPARQQAEAAKAEADVAAQFKAARDTAAARLEQFGVDPSQTRQGALDLGTRVAEAAAQSSAGNQARTAAENLGRQLRSEAISVGRGYPAQYQGAAGASGQSGNQAANTGLATTASGAQTMGTPYQWSGLGLQGAQAWGNIQSQSYRDQMEKWKADQESSSGWGDIIGKVAGTAMRFIPGFQEGGEVPSIGAIPDEMSPTGGAITDDVTATIDGETPAALNAGEFVFPKDVMQWKGEEWAQKEINKARQAMAGGNGERPAQPEAGPPQMPADSVGAIPMPVG